jgi:hypothetical protein
LSPLSNTLIPPRRKQRGSLSVFRARTRRAYRTDVAHFMRTFDIRTPEELRKIDHFKEMRECADNVERFSNCTSVDRGSLAELREKEGGALGISP